MDKLFILACAAAMAANAATKFPDALGDHDFTNPESWGGALPSDSALFETKDATYVGASGDASFSQIYVGATGIAFDLTATPQRKITVGSGGIYPYYSVVSATIKGGTWDFGDAHAQLCPCGSSWNSAINSSLTIADGAVVTNVGQVYSRYGNDSSATGRLEVTSGVRLYATHYGIRYSISRPLNYAWDGDASHPDVVALFSGGSRSVFSGGSGKYFSMNAGVTLVCGKDTYVDSSKCSYTYVGDQSHSMFHVTDGAEFKSGSLIASNSSTSRDGRTYVDNGGKLTVVGTTYLGSWGTYGEDNQIIAGSGGEINFNGAVDIAGTNNWVICSNGSISVEKTLSLGKRVTDRNLGIKICGPHARYSEPASFGYWFMAGGRHFMIFDDYATNVYSGTVYMEHGSGCGTNTFAVLNGAHFEAEGFRLEPYSGSTSTGFISGDLIRVENGGEFVTQAGMQFAGEDTQMVISNGLVDCRASTVNSYLMVGSKPNGCVSTNMTITLAGTKPRLRCGSTLYLHCGAKIVWQLPPEGYESGWATVWAKAYSTDGTVKFEVNGVEEVQRRLRHPKDFVLMEGGSGAFSLDRFADVVASLPEGCSLSRTSDGKKILLHVVPRLGTTLIVR